MVFFSSKFDPNIHQNAPNCTIFRIFFGGACPRTPLAKHMASRKFPNLKKNILAPPPKSWGRPCVLVNMSAKSCMNDMAA